MEHNEDLEKQLDRVKTGAYSTLMEAVDLWANNPQKRTEAEEIFKELIAALLDFKLD